MKSSWGLTQPKGPTALKPNYERLMMARIDQASLRLTTHVLTNFQAKEASRHIVLLANCLPAGHNPKNFHASPLETLCAQHKKSTLKRLKPGQGTHRIVHCRYEWLAVVQVPNAQRLGLSRGGIAKAHQPALCNALHISGVNLK